MNLVIKIGGAEGIADHQAAFVRNLRELVAEGHRVTIVHGGSDAATRLGEELGTPARFATSPSGHTSRLTDARTLEIFTMATALINRSLVSALQAAGVNAFGLSGLDGRALEAERKGPFRVVENGRRRLVRGDLTGRPKRADGDILQHLLDASCVPVVAPLGIDRESSVALNVDGDRAAAAIARAVGAEVLVILTAVPGVLADFPREDSLIGHVPTTGLDQLIELAGGRMKKKVLAASEALRTADESGTPPHRVVIATAAAAAPITSALAGCGTVLGAPLLHPVPQS